MTQPPSHDLSPAALLPHVRTIAHEAGQVILRFYNDHCVVSTKGDGTPVTQADHAAEAVILPALRHLTPGVPIVAEESSAEHGFPDLGNGVRFWLVDPLDGTKEFIDRNGEFTVNIALIERGVPVLGVVYAPVLGDLYAGAGPGTASHSTENRGERPIHTRRPPDDGLTVVGSRSYGNSAATDAFLTSFTVRERLACGSSLKFCTVAAGRADLYPRFGPTSEWDIAAGHAVLTAAGGRLEGPDGAPIEYGKPGFLNGNFVAYGW